MQHHVKIILVTFLFLISFNSANASSTYTIHCPENIAVAQKAAKTYDGWRSITTQPNYYLSGVTLFSGKPEEMASLKPDTSNHAKSTWKFSSNEQIYVVCEYNQTSIQLTQSLPQHTTTCIVDYDQNAKSSSGGYIPKLIRCTSSQ